MKSPADYLRGRAIPAPLDAEPVVTLADAEAAILEALADADRYKERLLFALRRAQAPAAQPAPMTISYRAVPPLEQAA